MSFTKAYEASLRKHHSIVVRPIFTVRALTHVARYEGVPLSQGFLRKARLAG